MDYDNDIFYEDLQDDDAYDMYACDGYDQYQGYEDYEPNPYDGTYSEC